MSLANWRPKPRRRANPYRRGGQSASVLARRAAMSAPMPATRPRLPPTATQMAVVPGAMVWWTSLTGSKAADGAGAGTTGAVVVGVDLRRGSGRPRAAGADGQGPERKAFRSRRSRRARGRKKARSRRSTGQGRSGARSSRRSRWAGRGSGKAQSRRRPGAGAGRLRSRRSWSRCRARADRSPGSEFRAVQRGAVPRLSQAAHEKRTKTRCA